MKTLVLIISILAVSDISACAATGLVRTQLEKWKIQEFNDIGLKVDLPVQPFGKGGYFIKERASSKVVEGFGCKLITIKMHPIWANSEYAEEPFYLINIMIARLDEKNYLKYKTGKHNVNGFDQFRETYKEFHETIKSYQASVPGFQGRAKDILQILRKDYRVPNGDYILCGAYIYAGSEKFIPPENEDIKATERILNSVKFLEKN